MKQQAVNPYLPSWEYVPDGEPHVFDGRVYVYGSHDRFGAPIFCVNDYVCWSAPVDDLSDWRYEGVIYKKKQDPANPTGLRCLYAPDVTKGPDGRYYLYYAYDFLGRMGVAVSDKPQGPYEYYGHVHYADGHEWGTKSGEAFPFDPGVLTDDDGRVYLFSGFATKVPAIASRFHNLTNEGGVGMELEQDMLTIKDGPHLLFPISGKEGAFPGHAFFEASSIRKVDGRYCFVYSGEHNHELCYAMADAPLGPYTYGGVLVDIGDVFLDGREDELHARNYLGNTHGGMLEIDGEWYIFYHRHTSQNSYARQACAEHLERSEDGGFLQAEITSCGLNGGPLAGKGRYEARIACNLWSAEGTGRYDGSGVKKRLRNHPYFTQTGKDRERDGDQYITGMRNGAVAGFKYFDLTGHPEELVMETKGAEGKMGVYLDENCSEKIAEIEQKGNGGKGVLTLPETDLSRAALYFRYEGEGVLDFHAFRLR